MNPERFKTEILPLREKLFHIARNILEDEQDAEDTIQNVFLKLWHLRNSLDQHESLAAFATTVTKNSCIDLLRIRKMRESLKLDDYNGQAGTDNPYLKMEQEDTEQILKSIIENLPPLQQTIIKMKDIEEYEVDEIAKITGSQPEAVRVNLSRARKKVREEYRRYTNR
jgi:RNA polymerase sigma-70 factor, ECF subfamily